MEERIIDKLILEETRKPLNVFMGAVIYQVYGV
jgi:hypothetical protein